MKRGQNKSTRLAHQKADESEGTAKLTVPLWEKLFGPVSSTIFPFIANTFRSQR